MYPTTSMLAMPPRKSSSPSTTECCASSFIIWLIVAQSRKKNQEVSERERFHEREACVCARDWSARVQCLARAHSSHSQTTASVRMPQRAMEPTALDSAALLPKRSTERRLRKMSQEFSPTAFAFHVQARVLCVGMAVVYRVAISVTTTTTYTVGAPLSPPQYPVNAPPGASCQAWVIAMSQSKFRTFYSHVRAILEQPDVQAYRARSDSTTWTPFERFLDTLADVLAHYDHLHAAFAIHTNVAAIHESNAALEAFLTDCWRALEPIIPSLAAEPHLPAPALGREVLSLYVLLRDFLAFPECILEANCVYASAILSLEDVEELLPTVSDQACSICLERLTLGDTRELDPADAAGTETDGSDAESRSSTSSATDALACAESTFSVKLPCAHAFHENCIMAWLRHNPSCPECRASVGMAR